MTVTFREAKLDNGLQFIAEVDPDAHTAAAGFWVATGARDEVPQHMGVSHFLEHMLFKGTETRSAEDINRAFDDLGAVSNAFTSSEMTAYWLHVLPENLSKGVSVLSDMLRPALRAADFDAEKEVILEEIAMYNDQPFWVVYEKAMAHLYPEHPLGHRVLGTKETVGQLEREVMLAYFDKRYASDNITFAAAGAVDFDQLLDQLNDCCGSWSPSSATRDLARPKSQSEREDLSINELAQAYLLMLGPAPDAKSDQRHAAGLLSHVFGGSDSSRLYWKLVETGIAEEAQSSFDPRQNAGEFATWAVIQPDRAEEVEQMIRAEIAHLPNTIEQAELDRARARIATAAVLASERPLGRVNRLASNWLTRAAYIPIETDMQAIDAITVEDLCDCASSWPLEPTVTMIAHG